MKRLRRYLEKIDEVGEKLNLWCIEGKEPIPPEETYRGRVEKWLERRRK